MGNMFQRARILERDEFSSILDILQTGEDTSGIHKDIVKALQHMVQEKRPDGSVSLIIPPEVVRSIENVVLSPRYIDSDTSPNDAHTKRDLKSNVTPMVVHILNPSRSDATIAFASALTKWISPKIFDKAEPITVEAFNSDGYEKADVILVVCNISSRAGADITNALSDVRGDKLKGVIIIALRTNDRHDMPSQSTKDMLKRYSQIPAGIGDIVDVVYTRENGIYDCDWNRLAYNKLERLTLKK